jgi:hypothetical protein
MNRIGKKRKNMKNKSMRHVMILAATSALTGLCLPIPSRADTVDAGYDLFTTVEAGTFFDGIGNLQGVPLNTYNFGGSIGVQNVGNTDTIVQRLQNVTATGSTSLQLDALQLESVNAVFGSIPGIATPYAFITLDPSDLSLDVGTMTTNANHTFTSSLNVYFDVLEGSLTGPVYSTGDLTLTSTDVAWTHQAPPGALEIPGVNYDLNGVNTYADFWPVQFTETESGAAHEVDPTPDATSTLALLLMPAGLVALGAARGKVARRA